MATIILKNLYHNGEQVKEIIQNGDIIYVGAQKLVFDVDKDSISFEDTGGSTTITITANDKWTMTKPEWITASQTSGTSAATITLSASATETERTGNIVIACGGKTKTISVIQAQDYSKTYFTIEALEDGVYNVKGNKNQYYYSINGGEWVATQIETYDPTPITLQTGDTVRFKGFHSGQELFSGTAKKFNVYGNAMSLQYLDDFITKTSFYYNTDNLSLLFKGSGVVDAGNLVLPDLILSYNDYAGMFSGCTSLTTAPELPANSIKSFYTYSEMFKGCTKLNYVKCLATTDPSAGWSGELMARDWLLGVSPTGTFVKAAGANWQTGTRGIPSGWTVIEE